MLIKSTGISFGVIAQWTKDASSVMRQDQHSQGAGRARLEENEI